MKVAIRLPIFTHTAVAQDLKGNNCCSRTFNSSKPSNAKPFNMNVTEGDKVFLSTLHSTIFIIGIPGNIFIIIAFHLSTDFRRRPSTCCLILLTIADLVTNLFAVPYYTTGLLVRTFDMTRIGIYTNLCKVLIFIITTAGIVRIFAFTLMSIDRFVAIAYPYHYNNRIARKNVLVVGLIIWIHASLSTLPAVSVDGWVVYNARNEALCKFTSPPVSLAYTIPMVAINFAAPTFAVIIMNCKVFLIARNQLKSVFRETERYCQLCRDDKSAMEKSQFEQDKEAVQLPVAAIQGKKIIKSPGNSVIPIIHVENAEISELEIDRGDTVVTGRVKQANEILGDECRDLGKSHPKMGPEESFSILNRQEYRDGTKNNANKKRGEKISILNATKTETAALFSNRKGPMRWLRMHSSRISIFPINSGCKHSNLNKNSRELNIAISTIFLALMFVITWTPYVITRLIITIWKDANSPRLETYTSMTTVINSGLNPLIILLTRKEVRGILQQKLKRNN